MSSEEVVEDVLEETATSYELTIGTLKLDLSVLSWDDELVLDQFVRTQHVKSGVVTKKALIDEDPVEADNCLAEHVRQSSSMTYLSRSGFLITCTRLGLARVIWQSLSVADRVNYPVADLGKRLLASVDQNSTLEQLALGNSWPMKKKESPDNSGQTSSDDETP